MGLHLLVDGLRNPIFKLYTFQAKLEDSTNDLLPVIGPVVPPACGDSDHNKPGFVGFIGFIRPIGLNQ
jgi:hypothetical protein